LAAVVSKTDPIRMKNCYLFVALLCTTMQPLLAQNTELRQAIHAKINVIDYRLINNADLKPGQGFELGYYRNLGKYLNIGIPFKVGLVPLPNDRVNSLIATTDLVAQVGNMKPGARITPYLFGGLGAMLEKSQPVGFQFPFGGGVNVRLSQFASINVQGELRKAMRDNRDNLQLGVGYVYLLHKSTEQPPVPVMPPTVPPPSEENMDTDADGTLDVLDHCPTQPGPAIALGCPDADLDSIADFEDRCPQAAGTITTQGCPDSDGDGMVDLDDKCPTEAGSARGCPDTDGDGFANADDKCPDMAGRWNGCPDADFDGVPDKEDRCPNDPGSPENKGCPAGKVDTDGDSFPDDMDKCPTQAGALAGCPDSDADGFSDDMDKCPKESGRLNGCPDTDNDGIADKDDPCPKTAGTCQDTDGDGITDDVDKCPNLYGSSLNNGCPEIKAEVKQRLELATRAVQFETGRATLKGSSYAVLDELYNIMLTNPEYRLVISGHTDDIGDDNRNLALSTDRAKACHDYFLFKGISGTRLRFLGFGEFKPIVENTTSEGRELNRRVEFEIAFE
jgi:OmpA-OmpF porin, OOP family